MLMLLSEVEGEAYKRKFVLIYESYHARVYRIAYSILKDSYLAEDVVQEVFIILAKTEIIDKMEDIKSYNTKAFIDIIARNKAINMFNKRKREHSISITEQNLRIVEEKEAWDNTQEVIMKMNLEDTVTFIKKLPEKYHMPLLLKYIHELSDRETAKMLDIEETTVRKRLERARKQLREKYEKELV